MHFTRMTLPIATVTRQRKRHAYITLKVAESIRSNCNFEKILLRAIQTLNGDQKYVCMPCRQALDAFSEPRYCFKPTTTQAEFLQKKQHQKRSFFQHSYFPVSLLLHQCFVVFTHHPRHRQLDSTGHSLDVRFLLHLEARIKNNARDVLQNSVH